MNNYINTIHAISRKRKISRYLERGVSTGSTFLNVDFSYKTGVDPNFKFDITPYDSIDMIQLLPVTSDSFFISLPDI